MSSAATATEAPRGFPHTRWSVVLATRKPTPESAAALETLCRDYWPPLYAYVRRCGKSPHDAQDLTQEFFCRLIEKRWLDADRAKGRLRSFLILALKRFMLNEWDRAVAARRGGGKTHAPLDTAIAESRFAADPQARGPEAIAPHFPHLEILECLGRGGMGVVYKARQKSLNRFVALKLLAPERAGDPQFAARFEKEDRALAALNHPNIVAMRGEMPASGCLLIDEEGKVFSPDDYGAQFFVQFQKHNEFVLGRNHPAVKEIPQTIPRNRHPGNRDLRQHLEWITAIQEGQPGQCYPNFEVSGYLTEIILLGCVATRVGKPLQWAGPNMVATNAPEAAPFIRPPLRAGWKLA